MFLSAKQEALRPIKALRRATTFSSLEDGAFAVVLPVLAQQSTGNTGVAVVFVAVTAPWALASVPIGYLADHMSRTELMRVVAFLRTGISVLLAALYLFDSVVPALVPILAFVLACCGVASDIARQSLVPQLLQDPDRLVAANTEIAKLSLLYGGFIGPLLGGWLLTLGQSAATLALAVFAAVTMIVTLGLPKTPALLDEPMRAQTMVAMGLEGFRHVYQHRVLTKLAILSFGVSVVWYVWETSFTAYALADNGLNASSFAYSILLLASTAGAFVSSRAVQYITRRFPVPTALAMSLAGWVIWFIVPALTANWLAILLCLAVGGSAGLMWNTITITARQLVTPGHLLGRTTAAYRMHTRTGRAVGAGLAGLLMAHMSWQHIFALCAGVIGVTAVGVLLLSRSRTMLEPES